MYKAIQVKKVPGKAAKKDGKKGKKLTVAGMMKPLSKKKVVAVRKKQTPPAKRSKT